MATRVETLRRNKSRADEHAFNRQVSIDEAKRTAAWIFKTVNELPWQQKAVFLTVAISLVAGGVNFVQHNNIGGAKDNFKAWAGAFNLTDGGDSPVVILTPTPDVTVGVNRPQLIPPAGDMSTPTAVKSTETSVPPATKVPDATAMAQPTPAESGPKVQTVIFDGGKLTIQEVIAAGSREGVKPLSQVSIYSNYVSIGVVPEAVYVANDNKIYCRCYLDTGAPIDFEISSASISIPGQRTAPITPDQYGKLQNDLLGKSAALNITPNESVAGWNIYTIKKYLSISHVTGETLLTFRK